MWWLGFLLLLGAGWLFILIEANNAPECPDNEPGTDDHNTDRTGL